MSQRLASIPGVGPIVASAVAASVPDASVFRCGREFAAWLGLVPRAVGDWRQGVAGPDQPARRRIRAPIARHRGADGADPLQGGESVAVDRRHESAPKPPMVIAVALANKMARMTWAMMVRGTAYRASRLKPDP